MLLSLLSDYKINGYALKWLHSYLSNRKHYVHMTHIYKLNGVNLKRPVISDPVNINQGVPQGSILGPILFILYVNGFDKLLQTSAL